MLWTLAITDRVTLKSSEACLERLLTGKQTPIQLSVQVHLQGYFREELTCYKVFVYLSS